MPSNTVEETQKGTPLEVYEKMGWWYPNNWSHGASESDWFSSLPVSFGVPRTNPLSDIVKEVAAHQRKLGELNTVDMGFLRVYWEAGDVKRFNAMLVRLRFPPIV
jgi:hypothetical protein